MIATSEEFAAPGVEYLAQALTLALADRRSLVDVYRRYATPTLQNKASIFERALISHGSWMTHLPGLALRRGYKRAWRLAPRTCPRLH